MMSCINLESTLGTAGLLENQCDVAAWLPHSAEELLLAVSEQVVRPTSRQLACFGSILIPTCPWVRGWSCSRESVTAPEGPQSSLTVVSSWRNNLRICVRILHWRSVDRFVTLRGTLSLVIISAQAGGGLGDGEVAGRGDPGGLTPQLMQRQEAQPDPRPTAPC